MLSLTGKFKGKGAKKLANALNLNIMQKLGSASGSEGNPLSGLLR
jgi:hypothetical protein